MKIATKTHVFKTLEKYQLIAKKGYGQNFLINENVTKNIVEKSSIDKENLIIEIGPGLGALTEELLLKFKKVIAIEIDKNMVNVLKDTFCDESKLEIINDDFLKVNLKEIMNNNLKFNKVSVVSNLPYYITSDILEKIILNRENKLDKVVVMMQKEVGKKLLNKEEKIESYLRFLLTNYCGVKELVYVSKNDFIPRPNVDSIVLEMSLRQEKYPIKNEGKFFYIFKECLKNKRKFLLSNLMNILNIDKAELIKIFNELNISENARIEELDVKEYVNLINKIN